MLRERVVGGEHVAQVGLARHGFLLVRVLAWPRQIERQADAAERRQPAARARGTAPGCRPSRARRARPGRSSRRDDRAGDVPSPTGDVDASHRASPCGSTLLVLGEVAGMRIDAVIVHARAGGHGGSRAVDFGRRGATRSAGHARGKLRAPRSPRRSRRRSRHDCSSTPERRPSLARAACDVVVAPRCEETREATAAAASYSARLRDRRADGVRPSNAQQLVEVAAHDDQVRAAVHLVRRGCWRVSRCVP